MDNGYLCSLALADTHADDMLCDAVTVHCSSMITLEPWCWNHFFFFLRRKETPCNREHGAYPNFQATVGFSNSDFGATSHSDRLFERGSVDRHESPVTNEGHYDPKESLVVTHKGCSCCIIALAPHEYWCPTAEAFPFHP